MALLDEINNKIKTLFSLYPNKYFSEHDIHSDLAKITSEILDTRNELFVTTLEGKVVSRVHHEYPTPFRCYMKDTDFQMYTDKEYEEIRKNNPKFRLRRGHLDLVVFNPTYISENKFRVVTGKNYGYLRKSFSRQQPTTLDLAIEVVYYLGIDDKHHEGIMERRKKSTVQDYKKLVSLMDFKHENGIPFCKEAGLMFFANTKYRDILRKKIDSIQISDKVKLFTHIMYA